MVDVDGEVLVQNPFASAFAGSNVNGSVIGAFAFEDPPTIAPITTLISPAPGATLTAETPVVVDVTDADGGFARILLVVTIAPAVNAGVALLVHDGVAFRPGFKDFSTRTVISGGFRYSIRKDLGWADAIRVEVFAIDDTGNEGA